jgi:beta-carotene 3-hydroxylase
MRALLLAAASFVAMEPATYALHRWLMHGRGARLHRSHHRSPGARHGRFEANDWYPALFAGVALSAFAAGFNMRGWGWLVPVATGVSAYGLAYVAVHDGCIHGRLPGLRRLRGPFVARLAAAHHLHHRSGGEPYGMLLPIVPRHAGERIS